MEESQTLDCIEFQLIETSSDEFMYDHMISLSTSVIDNLFMDYTDLRNLQSNDPVKFGVKDEDTEMVCDVCGKSNIHYFIEFIGLSLMLSFHDDCFSEFTSVVSDFASDCSKYAVSETI